MRTNSLKNPVFSLLRETNEAKESHQKTIFINAFFCLEKLLSAFFSFLKITAEKNDSWLGLSSSGHTTSNPSSREG